LNATEFDSDAALPSSRKARTVKDYLALALATCGVGYLPLAPGTWGSLVGVGVWLVLRGATSNLVNWLWPHGGPRDPRDLFLAIQLVVITVITLIGIWAASIAEKLFRRKDPGQVVIDEVAGQLIALLPVPLIPGWPWPGFVVLAFLLFRAFDIIKPYPVRHLESLESGLGIVIDDVGAGAYAAVALSAIISVVYYCGWCIRVLS
jgi:phosphatidylglycerophosphatase A